MNDANSPSLGPTVRLELYLDGGTAPAEVLTEGPFHVDLDTTALPNGEHTLRVVRFDAAGASTERTIPFTVNNAPEPDVTGLEPGAEVAGRIGIDFAQPAPPPAPKRVGFSPWWYFVGSAVIFLGVYLFFILTPGYHILAPSAGETAAASEPVDQALMAVGQKVYTDNCQACHQDAGTGMPPAVPALAGNAVLKDADTVLNTIHKGSGAMQAFTSLDAQQLAGVATYVRNSWGNDFGGVSQKTATDVTGAAAPSTAATQAPAAQPAQPSSQAAQPSAQPAQPSASTTPAQTPTQTPAQPSTPAAQPAQPAQPSASTTPAQPSTSATTEQAPAASSQPAQPSTPAAQPAQPSTPAAQPAQPSAQAPQPSASTTPAQPSSQAAAQPAAPAAQQPKAAAPASTQAAAGGKPVYVHAPTELAASDGTELATLSIGAKLVSDGDDAGHDQVTINGWSMKGAESVIFLAMGTRVDVAMLTDAGQKAEKVVQTKQDDYGTTWMQVSLSGVAGTDNLVDDPDALWQQAADLYAATCSACHALHAPDSYTANQWPGTLKSMIPNTALTQPQVALITKYLQYHAKGM